MKWRRWLRDEHQQVIEGLQLDGRGAATEAAARATGLLLLRIGPSSQHTERDGDSELQTESNA